MLAISPPESLIGGAATVTPRHLEQGADTINIFLIADFARKIQ